MKRAILCTVAIMLAGGFATAHRGPYALEDKHLVQVDPTYQTATRIGNGPHNVAGFVFSEDGFIYGVNPDDDTLQKINPGTGASVSLGTLGYDLNWGFIDLDEDASGQLRLVAWQTGMGMGLFSLNRETGAASLVCVSENPQVVGLVSYQGQLWTSTEAVNPSDPGCGLEYIDHDGLHGEWLDVGPDGMIHVAQAASVAPHSLDYHRIDPISGVHEFLGNYTAPLGAGLGGIAYDPSYQPTPGVPSLGWRGAVMLAILLTMAGTVTISRRR